MATLNKNPIKKTTAHGYKNRQSSELYIWTNNVLKCSNKLLVHFATWHLDVTAKCHVADNSFLHPTKVVNCAVYIRLVLQTDSFDLRCETVTSTYVHIVCATLDIYM